MALLAVLEILDFCDLLGQCEADNIKVMMRNFLVTTRFSSLSTTGCGGLNLNEQTALREQSEEKSVPDQAEEERESVVVEDPEAYDEQYSYEHDEDCGGVRLQYV